MAKLEEQYAVEAEKRLCFDDQQVGLNNIQTEFEYCSATLPNRDLHDSKAFDKNNIFLPYLGLFRGFDWPMWQDSWPLIGSFGLLSRNI